MRACCVIVGLVLVGCQASASRHWESLAATGTTEALAGARAVLSVEARFGGAIRDAEAERRMQRIGRRLTQRVPSFGSGFQYRLLNSDRRNAVSLPGGYVYITRGLYETLSSDGVLAATLAHEIAHIVCRDHFKPLPRDSGQALDKELSADAYAASLLDAPGLDSMALVDLMPLVRDAQPAGWADARTTSLRRMIDGSENNEAYTVLPLDLL